MHTSWSFKSHTLQWMLNVPSDWKETKIAKDEIQLPPAGYDEHAYKECISGHTECRRLDDTVKGKMQTRARWIAQLVD